MASKKKRKKKERSREEIVQGNQGQNDPVSLGNVQALNLPQKENASPIKKNRDKRAKKSGNISLLTCASGMFLTFILGLYIGTLIPAPIEKSGHVHTQPVEAVTTSRPGLTETGKNIASVTVKLPDSVPQGIARRIGEVEMEVVKTPDDASRWAELGNLYFDANLPDNAIRAYEKSLAIIPDNADVWTDLGIMYREKEDFTKAIDCFRRATSLDPQHQNSLYNLGIVLSTDLHNKVEALEAWEKLLTINPSAHSPDGRPLSEIIKTLQ